MILRVLLLALGAAALVAALAIDRPDNIAITASCAVLAMVVGAGAVAADAIPLRRVPLACSVLTILLAVALLARSPWQAVPAAGIVVLQLVAIAWTVRTRRGAPAPS